MTATPTPYNFRKWLVASLLALLTTCLVIYIYDHLLGDGDGIIAKLGINPLAWALHGGVIIGLFLGIGSNKAYVSKVALILLSTLFGLWLVDTLLPFVAPQQEGLHRTIRPVSGGFPYNSYDSVYFKNYRPNVTFETQLSPLDGGGPIITHSINSLGIRGPEIGPKQAGTKRILLLGDSYLQSIQVAYEESIGPQLDQLLPDSVHIIQHGFPSWSPLLQWNWLLRHIEQLAIDEVVLFLFINDFYNGDVVGDSGYTPYVQFAENGEPKGFTFPPTTAEPKRTPWSLLQQQWRQRPLVRWVSVGYRRWASSQHLGADQLDSLLTMSKETYAAHYEEHIDLDELISVEMWDLVSHSRDTSLWSTALQERYALTAQYLDGIRQSLSERGITFKLAYIPKPWDFPEEGAVALTFFRWPDVTFPYQGLPDKLAQYANTRGIPLLDFHSGFQAYKATHNKELLYLPYDRHWTSTGHQVAAQLLYNFLTASDREE